ncbi:hypothetical protein ACFL6E_07005 [Candidatus Neomarinimicrobiota bacterium]
MKLSEYLLIGYISIMLPGIVISQTIDVKTMPLISTSQFNLAPAYNGGLGGISIALDDPLADGFVNPARLSAVENNLFFGGPYRDSWSQADRGWWSTEQQGSMVQGSYGGFILHHSPKSMGLKISIMAASSMEQLRHRSHVRQYWNPETGEPNGPMQTSVMNWPMSAGVAAFYPQRNISIGFGIDRVNLRGIDGLALFYPGAVELRQNGALTNYRLGLSWIQPRDGRLDILLFHKNYHLNQHAVYEWDPDIHNKDGERSWLAQVKGKLPSEDPVRLAVELTGQYKWHPKIPDYPSPEIRIPRDPGNTKAVRFGLGISNHQGKRLTTAIDWAMEVIDSKTWGDTTAPVVVSDTKTIKAGDPLFSNDYFITSATIKLGAEYVLNSQIRIQGGWAAKQFSLDYYHEDFVTGEQITATPQDWWIERNLTAGLVADFGQLEAIYQFSRHTGTGMPYANTTWWGWRFGGVFDMATASAGDILVPPTGLDFDKTPVVLHRLTLVFRLDER